MSHAKRKIKIEKRLGELRTGKYNGCWVCRSTSGTKTSRMSTGTRCSKCIKDGKTTPEVEEYERLKEELDRLNATNG